MLQIAVAQNDRRDKRNALLPRWPGILGAHKQSKQATHNQPTNQNKPTDLLLKKKKKQYVKAVCVSVPSSYSFDSMGHQIH